jgi:hypothetical protein
MPQLIFDFPATFFSALRKSPSEFAAEMRLAAAIHWFDQGMVSQGTAAEIAGLARGAPVPRRAVPPQGPGHPSLSRRIVSSLQLDHEEPWHLDVANTAYFGRLQQVVQYAAGKNAMHCRSCTVLRRLDD